MATAAFGSISSVPYASRTNTTVPAPTGITAGDYLLMIVTIGASPTAPNVTPPAGFNPLPGPGASSVTQDNFNAKTSRYGRFADVSDESTGNYTVTHTAASSKVTMLRLTGVDHSTPIPVTPTLRTATGGEGLTSIAPGLTTTTDNMLVVYWMQDFAVNQNALAPPGGSTPTFTQRLDQVIGYVATGLMATAGATGDKSQANNNSISTNPWAAGLIAFKSGAADTPPVNTAAPAVTGTAQVGQTLTVTPGAWNGTPTPTVTRKVQRSDNGTSGWTDTGGTGLTYPCVDADLGKYLSVLESATSTAGGPITQRSNVVGPVAPRPPLDVTVRLTGGSGNTNPAASLGGAESGTQISLSSAESGLFPATLDRTLADPGATIHRCVSLRNGESAASVNLKAYIRKQYSGGKLTLKLGVAAQAAGATVATIPNQTTAPSGVTLSQPTTEGAALDLGTVGPGQSRGLWHAVTIPASTPQDAVGDDWEVEIIVTPIP